MLDFANLDLSTMLPHGAAMLMIERVQSCNQSELLAQTTAHTLSSCVLRHGGVLSPYAAIEMAAQAAALHAFATAPDGEVGAKVLGAVRNLKIAPGLDDLSRIPEPLEICVLLVQGSGPTVIYEFVVVCSEKELVRGKMTLIQTSATFA